MSTLADDMKTLGEIFMDMDRPYRPRGQQVPATGEKKNDGPHTGDRMGDGSLFIGFSKATGEALYTISNEEWAAMEQQDGALFARLTDRDGAVAYVESLQAHGKGDWRLPTLAELETMQPVYVEEFNRYALPQGEDAWWASDEYQQKYGEKTLFGTAHRMSRGSLALKEQGETAFVRPVRTDPNLDMTVGF